MLVRPAIGLFCTVVRILILCVLFQPALAEEPRLSEPLPPQPLVTALESLAEKMDLQMLYRMELAADVKSPGARAGGTAEETLQQLLRGTGLRYEFSTERTFVILPPEPESDQSTSQPPRQLEPLDEEVLVKDSRLEDLENLRLREGVLPTQIFDHREISASGAVNLEQFINEYVSMGAPGQSATQIGHALGDLSELNLRGLGSDETLILINGRRVVSVVFQGEPGQADINGIPILAVKRIEVLPMTDSARYGGAATGGVINIILRDDYSDPEVSVKYGSSFHSRSETSAVDVGFGKAFGEGRTRMQMAFSILDENSPTVGSSPFIRSGQSAILSNNPGYFLDAEVPPLGATPNIRSVDGSPLFGPGTPSFTFVPRGYLPSDGLGPLHANAGRYNFDLPNTAQITGANHSLLTATTSTAATLTLRRTLPHDLEVYMEALGSRKEGSYRLSGTTSNSFLVPVLESELVNPFRQPVWVTVPLAVADGDLESIVESHRLVTGIEKRLGERWSIDASYMWNRFSGRHSAPSTLDVDRVAAEIEAGNLNLLQDLSQFPVNLGEFLYGVVEDPSVATMRDVVLSLQRCKECRDNEFAIFLQLEHREERFDDVWQTDLRTGESVLIPNQSQRMKSAQAGVRAPIGSVLNVEVAGRYDDYSLNGAATRTSLATPVEGGSTDLSAATWLAALKYTPVRDISFRASFSTGFRPPSVTQLTPIRNGLAPTGILGLLGLVDPLRGNTPVTSGDLIEGGNPNLEAEESRSLSLGIIVKPRWPEGMRFTLDYVRIIKTNNIDFFPGNVQALLDNESQFPKRIIRGDRRPEDPPEWAGPILELDRSLMNIARTKVEAFDFRLDYDRDIGRLGEIRLHALGTFQTHFRTQALPDTPAEENVGITGANPLKFRGNAGLTWTWGGLTVRTSMLYYDSYVVSRNEEIVLNQGSSHVSSQIYWDLHAAYRFPESYDSNLLRNVEVALTLKNILNDRPPFDAGNQFYYSNFGDPRMGTYSLRLNKRF